MVRVVVVVVKRFLKEKFLFLRGLFCKLWDCVVLDMGSWVKYKVHVDLNENFVSFVKLKD